MRDSKKTHEPPLTPSYPPIYTLGIDFLNPIPRPRPAKQTQVTQRKSLKGK